MSQMTKKVRYNSYTTTEESLIFSRAVQQRDSYEIYLPLPAFQRKKGRTKVLRYGVDQKKVNLVLDQLERCGFLHGVQHVSKNTSIVILDIAKF